MIGIADFVKLLNLWKCLFCSSKRSNDLLFKIRNLPDALSHERNNDDMETIKREYLSFQRIFSMILKERLSQTKLANFYQADT